jgi:hypothetical protein
LVVSDSALSNWERTIECFVPQGAIQHAILGTRPELPPEHKMHWGRIDKMTCFVDLWNLLSAKERSPPGQYKLKKLISIFCYDSSQLSSRAYSYPDRKGKKYPEKVRNWDLHIHIDRLDGTEFGCDALEESFQTLDSLGLQSGKIGYHIMLQQRLQIGTLSECSNKWSRNKLALGFKSLKLIYAKENTKSVSRSISNKHFTA